MDHSFRWTEGYSVKIAELDLQHQQLFQIVAQLDSAQREGRSDSIIGGILDKLIEHIISHFTAEEYLMEQHEFPNLAAHRHEPTRCSRRNSRNSTCRASRASPTFHLHSWLFFKKR